MDYPNRQLIVLNRIYMTICSFWATVNKELNLPTGKWLDIIDNVTIVWSFVIMITSFLKFFQISDRSIAQVRKNFSGNSGGLKLNSTEDSSSSINSFEFTSAAHSNYKRVELSDLLLLNYLPKMDEFGKLYYGLMLVTIGAALSWRLYLNVYRQSANYRKQHPVLASNGQRLFDAKCELIEFFMSGPRQEMGDSSKLLSSTGNQKSSKHNKQLDNYISTAKTRAHESSKVRKHALATIDQLVSARHYAESLASKRFHKSAMYPLELPKQQNLLARLHCSEKQLLEFKNSERQINSLSIVQSYINSSASLRETKSSKLCLDEKSQNLFLNNGNRKNSTNLHQVYRVPIRSADFLNDKSVARWKFLANHVHVFSFFLFITSIPLFYYTIVGLNAVRSQFHSDYNNNNKGNHHHHYNKLLKSKNYYFDQTTSGKYFLEIYGPLEQTYACTQASLFFMATNIIISLFYADILYKSLPIVREVRLISYLYKMELLTSLPSNEVYRQQLRIWAYFDNILVLDSFISKYSTISMATVIIGLSFGQSYLRVEHIALKAGTAAALISNLLSFTYLHLVSWHLELQSTPLHKAILSIVARETHHEAKRGWQRTLFGFFEPDWRRTFTLAGRYQLDLQSFLKTIFGLATASLVINRLFHKRAWEASFAHLEQQNKFQSQQQQLQTLTDGRAISLAGLVG